MKLGVPPPTKTVSSSSGPRRSARAAKLGTKRLDVLRLAVAAGHGDEIAVLAAPLAEGDVDVEGADLARGGDRLRALHRGQVWAHRPEGPAMPWRCRLRKNIRVMAGYASGTRMKPEMTATISAIATPAPVVDPSVLTSRK